MGSNRCMNAACGAAAPGEEWRKGWVLRSGGFALLCDKCGLAFEQSVYCEMFHEKESGWRECNYCGKRLHCGCIASKSWFDLLDGGGVQCVSCVKNSDLSSGTSQIIHDLLPQPQKVLGSSVRSPKDEKVNEFGGSVLGGACELIPTPIDGKMDDDQNEKFKNIRTRHVYQDNGQIDVFLQAQRESITGSSSLIKPEQASSHLGEGCLNIGLGISSLGGMVATYNSGSHSVVLAPPVAFGEGREQSKALSAYHQMQRTRHLLPRPAKTSSTAASEPSKEFIHSMRVARPPGEGRGRNQLLPRYWPRITDQELQQISGDSNSTIVPLFEKVLSASDAGRIGRLVLPKACAEAYFPPISQPEGLPLKIQDAKGKDWIFQFRFWPNNNSRMYVLEGVTPCIQSMQLQAGDTVTFSRIDPEGKLVMGFRKATNSVPLLDSQFSVSANGALGKETFFSGVIENLPIVSGYSGLLQSLKGTTDPQLSTLSEHLGSADGDISCHKTDVPGGKRHEIFPLRSFLDVPGGKRNDVFASQSFLASEKKRTRNIGSKSKRLLIDNEDILELKLSWQEAQDLLRPPPSIKPSILTIEDHEFEEYEEPPVFGKITIFTIQSSGIQEQWVQCDDCLKWRRLPVDVLLPPKWTCVDNTWDPMRSLCSLPDELASQELQNLLQQNADLKKQKPDPDLMQIPSELHASGLDALASAAALGDDRNQASPSVATTTRHPRHRPGCSCIVCIQPPSGKGPKHKPTCMCNVCMTVKRRFKTLMMRKKKRQFEHEEAKAHKKWGSKEDQDADSSSRSLQPLELYRESELEMRCSRVPAEKLELSKGSIDLNSQPEHDDQQAGLARVSMMSLLQVASLPLETYLKQNGLTSLACEQQANSSSQRLAQATGEEGEGKTLDESNLQSAAQGQASGDEEQCKNEQTQNDAV